MTPADLLQSYLTAQQKSFRKSGPPVLIGAVSFPEGKILCADPFLLQADLLQKRVVTPGTYSAYVQMADTGTAGRRSAYAWLQLNDLLPETWEQAMRFRVDSGLACFVDAAKAGEFAAIVNSFPGNYYDGKMAAGFRENALEGRPDGDWLLHSFSATGNMALCSSGMGDGTYTAWWGSAKDAIISTLLIDFELPA